jgi:hypothetical protein
MISMMEEEFGMRGGPPRAVMRFGWCCKWLLSLLSPLLWSDFLFVRMSLDSPSKLRARLLPSKRKKTTTQVPEPRQNSSFLKGTWETVWGCDVDDVGLVETPLEDIDSPLDSVPDQGNGLNEVTTATPTNGAPYSKDEDITPILSSDFPSSSDPNAWRGEEGHRDIKSLRTSTSHPAKLPLA